jgi:hypothetical protein
MIGARKFGQEPGFPVTIFLTYSFDPLFFERVPFDDLSMGGTRRILILADAGEIAEAMKRCAGQVFRLGRQYTLAEAKASNVFHPKMIVRLSPEGGRVWIGSGNLTYTGWGGNHELATTWSIGPGTDDAGAWLPDVFRSVGTVTSSEAFRTQIEIVLASFPWLGASAADPTQSPILLGMPNRPLAPQLARRWEGRRFATVKIYTGSTDVDGAFLLWAHRTFGVKKATICLTPPFASFDAKQLAKLPMEVRFVERDPQRRVHAKFYWFSGPHGDAAVMGSANCSAAAWLASHEHGNVELITVYDAPDRAAFAPILSDFDGTELLPKDVLTMPVKSMEPHGNEAGGQSYRITSLRLKASGRTIEALVEPAPESDEATLIVETKRNVFRVLMRQSGARWVGRLSQETTLGGEPVFAVMEIPSGRNLVLTSPRWIDNERAIENAARDRHVDPNHEVFSGRGFGGADEHRIMEAIYAISSSLLNFETPDLSTLPKEHGGNAKPDTAPEPDRKPAGPVDPSTLTYSLDERAGKSGAVSLDHGGAHGISLHGVMRMLFAADDELEVDLSQERWSADEPEKYAPDDEPDNDPDEPPEPPVPRSDAEALAVLRGQIDHFLFELAKPSFAEACPAATLAQALVFPILLGIKGNEEGWLSDDALASVACRVVHVMFARLYGRDKPKGLIDYVKARYAAAGKQEEFLKAVGDGALYTVLLAAVAKPEAQSLAALVQQADAITLVMNCADLIATSHPDDRSALVQNVIIREAAFAVNERAGALVAAMKKLTASMQTWDRLNPGRTSRSTTQPAGTVLWSSYGWEVTPRTPAETYCSGVNLQTATANNPDIQCALDELWQAMRMARPTTEINPTDKADVASV